MAQEEGTGEEDGENEAPKLTYRYSDIPTSWNSKKSPPSEKIPWPLSMWGVSSSPDQAASSTTTTTTTQFELGWEIITVDEAIPTKENHSLSTQSQGQDGHQTGGLVPQR